MGAFAIIALSIAATVAGSPREAVVVPVGPKSRSEEEKQCVRQRIEAIVDSSGGGRLSGRPVYALSNESWVESETQTYGVVRQQNFTYFGYHTSPWRSFAGRRSGMSKPAFVRWLADSKYVAAWHVEEDVFFMETMSTPRQDMLVGALEGFLEDLPSS